MSNISTIAFRNIVRVIANSTDADILGSWTDPTSSNKEKRIVTFCIDGKKEQFKKQQYENFMKKLKEIMVLVGVDPDKHKLRITKQRYIKCDCIVTNPKFN